MLLEKAPINKPTLELFLCLLSLAVMRLVKDARTEPTSIYDKKQLFVVVYINQSM